MPPKKKTASLYHCHEAGGALFVSNSKCASSLSRRRISTTASNIHHHRPTQKHKQCEEQPEILIEECTDQAYLDILRTMEGDDEQMSRLLRQLRNDRTAIGNTHMGLKENLNSLLKKFLREQKGIPQGILEVEQEDDNRNPSVTSKGKEIKEITERNLELRS